MFPETESLFKSARESHEQIIEALKTQLDSLREGGREEISKEIRFRIADLKESRIALKNLQHLFLEQMVDIADNYSPEAGDALNLMFAQQSLEIFERIDDLVIELMSLEEKALKDISLQKVPNG